MNKYFIDMLAWIVDTEAREEPSITQVGIEAEYWDKIERFLNLPLDEHGFTIMSLQLDKRMGLLIIELWCMGEKAYDQTFVAKRMEVSV